MNMRWMNARHSHHICRICVYIKIDAVCVKCYCSLYPITKQTVRPSCFKILWIFNRLLYLLYQRWTSIWWKNEKLLTINVKIENWSQILNLILLFCLTTINIMYLLCCNWWRVFYYNVVIEARFRQQQKNKKKNWGWKTKQKQNWEKIFVFLLSLQMENLSKNENK